MVRATTSVSPWYCAACRMAAEIISGMSMISPCIGGLPQNLGIRRVLLIIAVPEAANSRLIGCSCQGPSCQAPPHSCAPSAPCQAAQASTAVMTTLVGMGVPSKYATLPMSVVSARP